MYQSSVRLKTKTLDSQHTPLKLPYSPSMEGNLTGGACWLSVHVIMIRTHDKTSFSISIYNTSQWMTFRYQLLHRALHQQYNGVCAFSSQLLDSFWKIDSRERHCHSSIQVTPTTLFYTSLVSLLSFRLRDVAYINTSIEEALKHTENYFRWWVSRKYQFATLTEKQIAVSIKLIFQWKSCSISRPPLQFHSKYFLSPRGFQRN